MRIVMMGPLRSTFVQTDIAELGKVHDIVPFDTVLGKGAGGLVTLLRLTLRVMFAMPKADALYCWFADYHTLIPTIIYRLFGKKVYVVAGGYDVGYLPELNYGARMRPARWFCAGRTFRYANMVLPVSQYAYRQLQELTGGKHAPATVVYNGVLTERFPSSISTERKPIAITVSQGDSITEYRRKRLDLFIDIAKHLPEFTFRLIGPTGAALDQAKRDGEGVANLRIEQGFVSLPDVIIPAYLEAACYCQLSYEETFGMAVVEAMLCGCIPITSNGGALPEVTGRDGYDVAQIERLISAIRSSLHVGAEEREHVRAYAQRFAAENRGTLLRSVVR